MAAYGRVVVVTINYRLGVLGTVGTHSRAVDPDPGIMVGYAYGVLSFYPDSSEHSIGRDKWDISDPVPFFRVGSNLFLP